MLCWRDDGRLLHIAGVRCPRFTRLVYPHRLRLLALDELRALLVAMQKVDENATPEHAATLNRGRILNAIVGLVGAPIALIRSGTWLGSTT